MVSPAPGVAKRGTKAARELIEGGRGLRVSCVRFSPNPANPVIVSAGWDKVVKVSFVVWSLPSRLVSFFSFAFRLNTERSTTRHLPTRPAPTPPRFHDDSIYICYFRGVK